MRIISGEARGRSLFAPQGQETRPTSDKIRGSVFNIIGARVVDARVIDPFGGTGALALEALSRGAAFAVISDSSRQAVQAIERNARGVLKDAFEGRARIMKADYRAAIERAQGPFDLVFLDPPYRMVEAYADALTRLEGKLSAECLVVLERRKDADIPLPGGFARRDVRIYGDTAVEFIEPIEGAARLR